MATSSTKPGMLGALAEMKLIGQIGEAQRKASVAPKLPPKLGFRDQDRQATKLETTRVLPLSDKCRKDVEGEIASTDTSCQGIRWKSLEKKRLAANRKP